MQSSMGLCLTQWGVSSISRSVSHFAVYSVVNCAAFESTVLHARLQQTRNCASTVPRLVRLDILFNASYCPYTSAAPLQRSRVQTRSSVTMLPLELTLVLAATRDMGIGLNGTLPWTGLKKEMAYFARVTKRLPPQVNFPPALLLGSSSRISSGRARLIRIAGPTPRPKRGDNGPQNLGLHPVALQASQGEAERRYLALLYGAACVAAGCGRGTG